MSTQATNGSSDALVPQRAARIAKKPARGTAGSFLHWFGIACLLGAAGCAGFIVWTLWGTGLTTKAAQDRLGVDFQSLEQPTVNIPPPPGWAPIPGSLYGEIVIPAIGLHAYVVQGTDYGSLQNGPGHYVNTANPWDLNGRVGIAGHRTTYLHPFFHLDLLKPGDTITIRTPKYGDYTYRVSQVFVLPASVAGKVLAQTAEPTLVLTTCNPTYSSAQRLIVTADRISTPTTTGG